jgi:hypothetical protein
VGVRAKAVFKASWVTLSIVGGVMLFGLGLSRSAPLTIGAIFLAIIWCCAYGKVKDGLEQKRAHEEIDEAQLDEDSWTAPPVPTEPYLPRPTPTPIRRREAIEHTKGKTT